MSETKYTTELETFLKELETEREACVKLQKGIAFMEASLGNRERPHFKNFWDTRHLCSALFKENLVPTLRTELWEKFCELTQEARRLRHVIDEQSAFTAEQITLALEALEQDIKTLQDLLKTVPFVRLPNGSHALKEHQHALEESQHELQLLTNLATRITSLRKEVAVLHIKEKTDLFKRLSELGDAVFPRRKELIKEISTSFTEIVEAFHKRYFSGEHLEEKIIVLRDEVKALQQAAKVLSLNTKTYNSTRKRLGECWERLKVADQERREALDAKKAVFDENAQKILTKIEAFQEKYTDGKGKEKEAFGELDAISKEMRNTELGRDQVKTLRDALGKARKPFEEKSANEATQRKERIKQQKQQQANQIEQLHEKWRKLLETGAVEDLREGIEAFAQDLENVSLSEEQTSELQVWEFKIFDRISLLSEEEILGSLSTEAEERYNQICEVLDLRDERRERAKQRLDVLRASSEASGLDFTQSMHYTQLLQEQRAHLDALQQQIEALETELDSIPH